MYKFKVGDIVIHNCCKNDLCTLINKKFEIIEIIPMNYFSDIYRVKELDFDNQDENFTSFSKEEIKLFSQEIKLSAEGFLS